jgi:hypothetical protein
VTTGLPSVDRSLADKKAAWLWRACRSGVIACLAATTTEPARVPRMLTYSIQMVRRGFIVGFLLLCVTGCGSSSSGTSAAPPGPTSSGARQSASKTSAKPRHSEPDYGLSGFGATDGAWNNSHTPDRKFAPNAVYNPDPAVPTGADYNQVLHDDGHVTGYDLHFVGQPISEAKAAVFANELPRDATSRWFAVKDTCAQMLVHSATLGKALGSKALGDGQGIVLVEFSSGTNEDHYSPESVNDALFILAEDTSPSNAPGC